jgi:hypothetical protein
MIPLFSIISTSKSRNQNYEKGFVSSLDDCDNRILKINNDSSILANLDYNKNIKILKANCNEEKESRINTIISHYNNQTNNTVAGSNSSLNVQTQAQVQINTSLLIDENHIDIKYDYIKYLSLIAFLCCWCFPFTGIPALIYAFFIKKFYKLRDMVTAKAYLLRVEKLILMTFICGFVVIAILFAFMQVYYFNLPNLV